MLSSADFFQQLNRQGFDTNEALDRLGGEANYLFLIERFIVVTDKQRGSFAALMMAADPAVLQKAKTALHTLKGGALTIGAVEFAGLIMQIEKDLLSAGLAERQRLYAGFEEALDTMILALKRNK